MGAINLPTCITFFPWDQNSMGRDLLHSIFKLSFALTPKEVRRSSSKQAGSLEYPASHREHMLSMRGKTYLQEAKYDDHHHLPYSLPPTGCHQCISEGHFLHSYIPPLSSQEPPGKVNKAELERERNGEPLLSCRGI